MKSNARRIYILLHPLYRTCRDINSIASHFTSWVIPEKFPLLFAWLNGPWACLNSVGYSNRVVPPVGPKVGCILSWLDRITALLDSWNFSFLFRPFLSSFPFLPPPSPSFSLCSPPRSIFQNRFIWSAAPGYSSSSNRGARPGIKLELC